jgi:integrase
MRPATWLILDRGEQISTHCGESDLQGAQQAHAQYLNDKWTPDSKRAAEHVEIADVIAVYARDIAPDHARPKQTADRAKELLKFFGGKRLSAVNGALCRQYVKQRGSRAAATRELEDFRAAVRHYHREGFVRDQVAVWIPKRADPRNNWITRDEAARLIWAAWRRPAMQHVARFCIFALYTGSRLSRILQTTLGPSKDSGYVDLETGLFMPKPGHRQTKKRQPAIPLPKRLLSHLRRWHRNGQQNVVEWRGQPLGGLDHSFPDAVRAAGLKGVTPHVLKHTAVTWLLRRGVDVWTVAGFTGTSPATIQKVYGHHAVDHLAAAHAAIDRPGRQWIANETREPKVNRNAQKRQKNVRKQRTGKQ